MAESAVKKEKKPSKILGFFKGIGKYFRDVVTEMKKVVWPTKKQVLNNTGVVIVVVIAAGVFLFGLDSLFGLILKFVLQRA
ncbi:MAG: preprotein translocase subunit SecE [Pygmaiobacter sp.]